MNACLTLFIYNFIFYVDGSWGMWGKRKLYVDLYGYIGHIATYDYYSLQRSQEYIDLFFILFSRINTDCIKQNLVHE